MHRTGLERRHLQCRQFVLQRCFQALQHFNSPGGRGWTLGSLRALQSFKRSLEAVATVDTEDDIVFNQYDAFIVQLYGSHETTTSGLRGRLSGRKMVSKSIRSAPRSSKLPPITAGLCQHVMRAHLQTAYWKSAAQNLAPSMYPINFGWEIAAATDTLLKPTCYRVEFF